MLRSSESLRPNQAHSQYNNFVNVASFHVLKPEIILMELPR